MDRCCVHRKYGPRFTTFRGPTTNVVGTGAGANIIWAGLVNPIGSRVMAEVLSILIRHRPETEAANGGTTLVWLVKAAATSTQNVLYPASGPLDSFPGRKQNSECKIAISNTAEGGAGTSVPTGETLPTTLSAENYRAMKAKMIAKFAGNFGQEDVTGLPIFGSPAVIREEMIVRQTDDEEGVLVAPGEMIALQGTALSAGDNVHANFVWREWDKDSLGKGWDIN